MNENFIPFEEIGNPEEDDFEVSLELKKQIDDVCEEYLASEQVDYADETEVPEDVIDKLIGDLIEKSVEWEPSKRAALRKVVRKALGLLISRKK